MELTDDQCTILILRGQVTDLEIQAKRQQETNRALVARLEAWEELKLNIGRKLDKQSAWLLRATVAGWLYADSVTLLCPQDLARQMLAALDALAVIHGTQQECSELDATIKHLNTDH